MALTRRHFVSGAIAGAFPLAGNRAIAQEWPSQGIKIVVPFGPGGSADVIARYVAAFLKDSLKQSVVIENRTGAAGTIGTYAVANAKPDGYTLIAISNTITANETLYPNRRYDLIRSLAPVALLNVAYNALVVHPSVKANTVAELIALAKSKPGMINYASSGTGSVYHIIGENFRTSAGIQVQHIPFRSSDQARTAVIGGTVDYMFDAVPTMLESIRGGLVRVLATTGPKRDRLLPDVSTIAETLPGFEGTIWIGLLAPAATPKPIVERLNSEVNSILNMQSTREWHAKLGASPTPMTISEFGNFLQNDVEKQRKWIQQAGIKIE